MRKCAYLNAVLVLAGMHCRRLGLAHCREPVITHRYNRQDFGLLDTGQAPEQALADACYGSEKNFEALAGSPTELVVAMGREGKRCAATNASKNPHTAAMAAKQDSEPGRYAYRRRKWIAEPPNGWINSVLGFRQFSLRGTHRAQAEFKLD